MEQTTDRQAIVDEEQLRPLPVCYWVLAATSVFMALYGLLYVAMGVVFAFMPLEGGPSGAGAPDSMLFLAVFGGMGVVALVIFGGIATLQILTGFWIRKRRRRTMCLVTAGISCMFVPFGTLIGVFTFLALLRPSVAGLFAPGPSVEDLPHDSAPSLQEY